MTEHQEHKLEKAIDKIGEHDVHIDKLSNSVNSLAEATHETNTKLDAVVAGMDKQMVLMEKMSSLGRSLDTVRDVTRATEHIVNRMPDVDELKTAVKITEGLPSTGTIRWAVGILLTYLAVSGNYIIGHIHQLESASATHEKVDDIVSADFATRLSKLEEKHEKAD